MSSLKVEVEAKVSPTAKVEQPIPILANSIPIGGSKGQVLTKKSEKPYDVAWENPKGGEGGGDIIVEGVTEERVEEIISEKTADLQPKTDESLETESKEVVGAINEVALNTAGVIDYLNNVDQDISKLYNTAATEIDGEVVGEEEFSLQILLKNKDGEVVSTKTIALPKQEIPDIDLSNLVKKTDWIGYDIFGIAKLNSYKGLSGNSAGEIVIREPTNEQLDYRNGGSPKPFTRDAWALTVSKIDYAVKKAITESSITLTDEEKAKARAWLGIE